MKIAKGFDASEALTCPRCNQDYLHQAQVHVYFRDREDSNTGTVGSVCKGIVHESIDQTKNPSPRRDGIRIVFMCENCETTEPLPMLNIVQHKGCTFVYWEDH